MGRAYRYRKFAAECLRLAEAATSQDERLFMVSLAGGRLELAEASERGEPHDLESVKQFFHQAKLAQSNLAGGSTRQRA